MSSWAADRFDLDHSCLRTVFTCFLRPLARCQAGIGPHEIRVDRWLSHSSVGFAHSIVSSRVLWRIRRRQVEPDMLRLSGFDVHAEYLIRLPRTNPSKPVIAMPSIT